MRCVHLEALCLLHVHDIHFYFERYMSILLAELFPVQTDNIPPLYAYRLDTSGEPELNRIGGSLSWALTRKRPDDETWVWSKSKRRLYADVQCSSEELESVVKHCRQSGRDRFRPLMTIVPAGPANADPQAVADYVAWGLWHDVKYDIFDALNAEGFSVSPVDVRRKCGRKPRVVDGHPALQVYVSSEMTHHRTLKQIWEQKPDLDLRGLSVKDNTKDRRPLKGSIQEQTGTIGDHRERLLDYVSRERMETVLQEADPESPVVSVESFGGNGNTYEYVLDALNVIVHPRHYEKLGISPNVQNKLTLSPEERSTLLQKAVAPLQETLVGTAFNSQRNSTCFGQSASVNYAPVVRLGDGSTVNGENVTVQTIRNHGFIAPVASDASSVRLAILKAGSPPSSGGFGGEVQSKLSDLGLSSLHGEVFSISATASEIRSAAQDIAGSFDAALALLPDGHDTAYYTWKRETVSRGLPNQVLNHSTLGEKFTLDNIALGLFAKMGGVPYVLSEPLPYADRVVGLDIGRVSKERSDGTMSVAASTHLYGADGSLISYRLEEANVEGETIPPHLLRRMFPPEAYENKEILVHRDGPFRGNEANILEEIGRDIDSTFHLIAVKKKGAPRLYELTGENIGQPSKGDHVRTGDREAHVVSSLPPFSESTARPLQVRVCSDTLPIEEAIHSVLSFSLMHHGSVRSPRLPVSLHYSDRVAERLQNGIRPAEGKGRFPYWL